MFQLRAKRFREALFAAVTALLVAGGPAVAASADYVVVASTDPGLPRGRELAAGARLPIAPGQTVTLMHATGEVVVLRGGPDGAVAPLGRPASPAEAERMSVLRLMVASAPRRGPSRFGNARSLCPTAEALADLDAIAQAETAGCAEAASQALDAYVSRTAAP